MITLRSMAKVEYKIITENVTNVQRLMMLCYIIYYDHGSIFKHLNIGIAF